MMRLKRWWFITLIWALTLTGSGAAAAAEPVVHAVLLYSPTCGHCHKVIMEDLPPLLERYGERLHIIGVDVSTVDGQQLFLAVHDRFNVIPERRGVPTLIVGDVVLVGSAEIPEQLPGLIEQYLAQGGVDWPDIPGLPEVLAAAEQSAVTPEPQVTSPAPAAVQPAPAAPQPIPVVALPSPSSMASIDIGANLARDPIANGLAIVVLIGMIASVGGVTLVVRRPIEQSRARRPDWPIPVLCVIGLGVAAYLAYVETAQVTAVCGPIGDCNTVQQSPYARLFGLIPIGVLGVVGYLAIGLAWLVRRIAHGRTAYLAAWALFSFTLIGTFFSIYLTFLEPFVIGATCAWCLTSAIIMTLLLWLAADPNTLAGAIPRRVTGRDISYGP